MSELLFNAASQNVLELLSQTIMRSAGFLGIKDKYIDECCRAWQVERKDIEFVIAPEGVLIGCGCSWCEFFIEPYTPDAVRVVSDFAKHLAGCDR